VHGRGKTSKDDPIGGGQSKAIDAHGVVHNREDIERAKTEHYGNDMQHRLNTQKNKIITEFSTLKICIQLTQDRISIPQCTKLAKRQLAVMVVPNSQMPTSLSAYAQRATKNMTRD